jgi:hypothetical protein
MFCFTLQPLAMFRSDASTTSFTQPSNTWLDVTPFSDVVIWLHVQGANAGGGTLNFFYETSPTKEEAYFTSFVRTAFDQTSPLPWLSVDKGLLASATPAVAKWVRWRITNIGAVSSWDMTFRVFVAANYKRAMRHAARQRGIRNPRI